MKTILFVASILLSTQALATVTSVLPNEIFEPAQDTKVLQIDLKTISGVSCPGTIDMQIDRNSQGFYTIETNEALEFKTVNALAEGLSSSCRNEVFENRFNRQPVAICLSYGHAGGRVYLPVSAGKTVRIEFPTHLMIDQITELK